MKKKLIFYRETRHKERKWYILFPEYEGSKDDLEMVSGADDYLDKISDKYNNTSVIITNVKYHPFLKIFSFQKTEEDSFGATYLNIETNEKMWLCEVTKDIFGFYPESLSIEILNYI